MDVMKRRRTGIRRQGSGLAGMLAIAMVAFGAVAPSAAAPTPPAENHDPTAASEDELSIAQGDALVPGHSFEDGLDGWTLTDGHGGSPAADCPETLAVTQDWASEGESSLLIDGQGRCRQAGAMSEVVEIEPGEPYTLWADVRDGRVTWAGLHWIGADGEVLDSDHMRRTPNIDRLELTATAPEGATGVRVEVSAIGPAMVDDVLL